MAHFLIGALSTATFLLVMGYSRKHGLHIKWWHWILTILCFAYFIFVLEVIVSFLDEGAARAALVMGIFLGLIAVIWGVLLSRFVFAKK